MPASLKTLGLLGAASLVLAACQTVSYVPKVTPALVSAAPGGASVEALENGRQIYGGKCTACHSAEPIGRYSAEEWPGIIEEMAKVSKLTEAEKRDLSAYIFAVHRSL